MFKRNSDFKINFFMYVLQNVLLRTCNMKQLLIPASLRLSLNTPLNRFSFFPFLPMSSSSSWIILTMVYRASSSSCLAFLSWKWKPLSLIPSKHSLLLFFPSSGMHWFGDLLLSSCLLRWFPCDHHFCLVHLILLLFLTPNLLCTSHKTFLFITWHFFLMSTTASCDILLGLPSLRPLEPLCRLSCVSLSYGKNVYPNTSHTRRHLPPLL